MKARNNQNSSWLCVNLASKTRLLELRVSPSKPGLAAGQMVKLRFYDIGQYLLKKLCEGHLLLLHFWAITILLESILTPYFHIKKRILSLYKIEGKWHEGNQKN